MKLLVTGANGQLGMELRSLAKNHDATFLGSRELDITRLDSVREAVSSLKPQCLINCAAYTNVDLAETEEERAYAVNAIGARNLASACLLNNAALLHISTDFVFDGKKTEPYDEFDGTSPLGVYGRSKLAGETMIKEILGRHFIVRTSWLYGHGGKNFVNTMLKLSETRKDLSVVTDQIGSPTYTRDLKQVVELLMETDAYGTYHASNSGSCSWNEFAKEIFRQAGKDTLVLPITAAEYKAPAQRPANSVLKHFMLKCAFGVETPHWEDALARFLREEN